MSDEVKELTMEDKIHALRRNLVEDVINKASFERRYRPNLEKMESCSLVFGKDIAALRRFQVAGRVYELVEFTLEGMTDCALCINIQTHKILEFSRYLDAEISLVDQMQEDAGVL